MNLRKPVKFYVLFPIYAVLILGWSLWVVKGSLFEDSKEVKKLNSDRFKNQVLNGRSTYLVKFYAPWCGYCKQLAPEYQKVAKSVQGLLQVGAVNCDEEKYLCQTEGIQGYPVVKVYYTNPKSKKRIPVEYQGERTASKIKSFALDRIPNFVKPVGLKGLSLEKFYNLANHTLPKVVIVRPPSNARKAVSPMMKSLSLKYYLRAVFGIFQDSSNASSVYQDFSLPSDSLPQIFVIPVEGKPILYEGEKNLNALNSFIKSYALKKAIDPKTSKKSFLNEAAAKDEL